MTSSYNTTLLWLVKGNWPKIRHGCGDVYKKYIYSHEQLEQGHQDLASYLGSTGDGFLSLKAWAYIVVLQLGGWAWHTNTQGLGYGLDDQGYIYITRKIFKKR
jgi:hypothetical protein